MIDTLRGGGGDGEGEEGREAWGRGGLSVASSSSSLPPTSHNPPPPPSSRRQWRAARKRDLPSRRHFSVSYSYLWCVWLKGGTEQKPRGEKGSHPEPWGRGLRSWAARGARGSSRGTDWLLRCTRRGRAVKSFLVWRRVAGRHLSAVLPLKSAPTRERRLKNSLPRPVPYREIEPIWT